MLIDFAALIIVLFMILKKVPAYETNFLPWLAQKEVFYQRNLFVSKAHKNVGKKILLVTFNLEDLGAPLMFLDLALSLHRKGYNVSVLSYAGGRHEKDLKREHIPYLISKELYDGTSETEKLLQSYDVVISGRISKMYFPSQEHKFIWWDHGLLECVHPLLLKESNNPSFNDIRFMMNQAKDVVFVSELQQKKLASCRTMPSEVIYNGLNPTGIKMNDPVIKQIQKEKNKGKTVFVTVGSIQLIKGQDILVDAVKFLPENYRQKAVFFIIGPEKNEKYADFLLQKSQGMSEIIWAGPIVHEKIGGVYESADVLLVPSRSDTAPLVVQEAAEHYMPSVITQNVGSTFITQNEKSGFVIYPDNPKALAKKIKFFIDNPEKIKEFGQVSRKNYDKSSSFEVFEKSWEDKINRKLDELKRKK